MWYKKNGADFSTQEVVSGLDAGSPQAASFFKFQSFTTAVVQDSSIRTRMSEALVENLTKGKGQKEFTDLVNNTFDAAGISRLKPHQIDNIYVTNTSLAYGAGQLAQMAEISDEFPFWWYSATMDSLTRPEHAALHGKIFKNGDFTFWPPLSYRCRCTAIPMTARQAGKYSPTAFPDAAGKEKLSNSISNKAFAGDKQKNYMKWLAEKYKDADKPTQKLIDIALKGLKEDIIKVEYDAFKELFNSDVYYNRIYQPFYSRQFSYVRKNAVKAELNVQDAQKIFAYTDYKNGLAAEMSRYFSTRDFKPDIYTPSQLQTFRKDLVKTLEKLPKFEGTVYRNLKNLDADVLQQWTKIGNIVEWDGVSSTTKSKYTYSDLPIRLIIDTKQGRDIENFSMYCEETEVLLMPAKMRVVKVVQTKKQTIITMNEQ